VKTIWFIAWTCFHWLTTSWWAGIFLGSTFVYGLFTLPSNMADYDAQQMKEKTLITVGYGDLDDFYRKQNCRKTGSTEHRYSVTYHNKEDYEKAVKEIWRSIE
jgi:hypothetical protein